ncbi:MAG: AhpC/TSA family protein [Candidatus Marinimicrobia bacterium]|nr:AhpC/TSA family protein [Candidatus Neomarinimicrobiota bacterium]
MARLGINEKAPDFFIKDIFGVEHSMAKYKGQKWMLSFFRYASCPACNLRVRELIQVYDELQGKGLSILSVFESPKESILKYVGKNELPFPIIPDPERELYKLYGIESSWIKYILGAPTVMKAILKGIFPGKMEGDLAILPADFLINEDGTIHTAYYGKNIGDHLDFQHILSFLN